MHNQAKRPGAEYRNASSGGSWPTGVLARHLNRATRKGSAAGQRRPVLTRLCADGAVQGMGHEEETFLLCSVTRRLPDRQLLRRELREHVVFAVAPDRSARAVECHERWKTHEIGEAGVPHSAIGAAIRDTRGVDGVRR